MWDVIAEHQYVEMDKATSQPSIPITNENKIIDILMKWWTRKYPMVDGKRNNNMFILASAFNDYGVSKSLSEYVLSQFVSKNHPMSEINTIINSAYKNTAAFGSKFYEDDDKLSQVRQKIKRGVSKKKLNKNFQVQIFQNKILIQ